MSYALSINYMILIFGDIYNSKSDLNNKILKLHQKMNENLQLNDDQFYICQNEIQNPQQARFNQMIGVLQDFLVTPQFQLEHQKFRRRFSGRSKQSFIKPELVSIFDEYRSQFTMLIQKEMQKKIGNCDFSTFTDLITSKPTEMQDQILQLFHSFKDCDIFVNLFLEQIEEQRKREGQNKIVGQKQTRIQVQEGTKYRLVDLLQIKRYGQKR